MPNSTQYTLDDFAETLIKEKNYTTLTPAMHDELKKDILDRAQEFLIAKTISKLSDDNAQKLSELLDKTPSDEQLQEFIGSCITDAPNFIGDTLFQFRQTYLGLV
jgi:hypothetical protein